MDAGESWALDVCNNSLTPDGSFTRLGPAQLYDILGPAILLPLYSSILLLVGFLWIYGLFWWSRTEERELTSSVLQLLPVINISLTIPVLLSPPVGPLVSLLQDAIAVTAMLLYTNFSIDLIGGKEQVLR